VTSADKLIGLEKEIFAKRDRKLVEIDVITALVLRLDQDQDRTQLWETASLDSQGSETN
jgi:hypothetical protein